MLGNKHFPLRLIRVHEVDFDQTVIRRIAVRLEREHCPLIGHVVIFSFKIVYQLYPLQDSSDTVGFLLEVTVPQSVYRITSLPDG